MAVVSLLLNPDLKDTEKGLDCSSNQMLSCFQNHLGGKFKNVDPGVLLPRDAVSSVLRYGLGSAFL